MAHQQAAVKDEAEEAMDVAAFEKKLNKLRKKYDKRVQAMKQDNDEIKEVCLFCKAATRRVCS